MEQATWWNTVIIPVELIGAISVSRTEAGNLMESNTGALAMKWVVSFYLPGTDNV